MHLHLSWDVTSHTPGYSRTLNSSACATGEAQALLLSLFRLALFRLPGGSAAAGNFGDHARCPIDELCVDVVGRPEVGAFMHRADQGLLLAAPLHQPVQHRYQNQRQRR